jgi:hypothetical protein
MLRELLASVKDIERLSFRHTVDLINSTIEHRGYPMRIVMDSPDEALFSQ